MKTLIVIGTFLVGGVMVLRYLPRKMRSLLNAAVKQRMIKYLERMMASLPENTPPKLIMSVLPKLEKQNDQLIAMLREQNELLRERRQAAD